MNEDLSAELLRDFEVNSLDIDTSQRVWSLLYVLYPIAVVWT